MNNCDEYAVVDSEDYHWLNQVTWRKDAAGYVVRQFRVGEKLVFLSMHRAVRIINKGRVVDHINGNPMDNRKKNLRECTVSQNLMNQKTKRKYKGVRKYFRRNKFKGDTLYYITSISGKEIGRFDTARLAAIAYNDAAIKACGEFARLNRVNMKDYKGHNFI